MDQPVQQDVRCQQSCRDPDPHQHLDQPCVINEADRRHVRQYVPGGAPQQEGCQQPQLRLHNGQRPPDASASLPCCFSAVTKVQQQRYAGQQHRDAVQYGRQRRRQRSFDCRHGNAAEQRRQHCEKYSGKRQPHRWQIDGDSFLFHGIPLSFDIKNGKSLCRFCSAFTEYFIQIVMLPA